MKISELSDRLQLMTFGILAVKLTVTRSAIQIFIP
jgi:hypothetical protein